MMTGTDSKKPWESKGKVLLARGLFFLFLFPGVSYTQVTGVRPLEDKDSKGLILAQRKKEESSLLPVVVEADNVFQDVLHKKIRAKGNTKIVYKDIKAFCDEAVVDTQTNVGELRGNVRIEYPRGTIYGEVIRYNFVEKTAEVKNLRLSSVPYYIYGKEGKKVSAEEYILSEGYFTTCDLVPPHYRLQAQRVLFYPGRKIVAKNVVMKIGNLPVFYLPYYVQPVKDRLPRVSLTPGKDEYMGFYMLSAWRYYFNEFFKGRFHLDYYEHKGIGSGITHKYKTENLGEGVLKLYYVGDRDKVSFDEEPYIHYVGKDRYKIQLRHFWRINRDLEATLELHKFSDLYFMRDYFYREYERDTHPLSYLLFNYKLKKGSLSLLTQKRLNRFYSETEYLPQLKYELFRTPVGSSKFYVEMESSFSNLNYKNASPSSIDDDALRFDFFTNFTYQDKIAWLNLKPSLGIRETYYSKNILGDENIFRTIFSSGIELSTNLYRQFSSPLRFLGVKADIIRHTITPILKYNYTHRPTTSASLLANFDSIDTRDRNHSLEFILENKFKAKYRDKVWDIFYFAPSLGYKFKEEGRGSHFTELNYDLEFKPVDWLYLEQNYKYDLDRLIPKEMSSDITLNLENFHCNLGYRYIRLDEEQITTSIEWVLSPKWTFNSYIRYSTTGTWEEQQYYLRRDLHCWFGDFGVDIDKPEGGITFWLAFRIKAFPEVGINFKKSYRGPKD